MRKIMAFTLVCLLSVCSKEKTTSAEHEETKSRAARTEASPAAPASKKDRYAAPIEDQSVAGEGRLGGQDQESLGRVFAPGVGAVSTAERRLEYSMNVSYQIESLKTSRAFFNQWIPRFGFLAQESASAHGQGYMHLTVRVKAAQLYAALTELDGIGKLVSENITVHDHTENLVHQQMLSAREDIRNRRRSNAAQGITPNAKNWESTENLLSASEDKQIATRMEEWRIGDRTQWATIQISLALPASAAIAPIEVPEFKNAFVGLLNVFLQISYALIYLIPLVIVGFFGYRLALRFFPRLHAWAKG